VIEPCSNNDIIGTDVAGNAGRDGRGQHHSDEDMTR